MKEKVFNLFYFAKAGFIDELGAVVHELGGTDAEKEAFLRSSVEIDYKNCQRFSVIRKKSLSGAELPTSEDSFRALQRLGRHFELFEEIFANFNASNTPLCCITSIVDGKPEIDITTDHSPFIYSKYQGHPKLGEGVMSDYLEDYMTPDGFDLPALMNDDYFEAIRILFNHGHYVSLVSYERCTAGKDTHSRIDQT